MGFTERARTGLTELQALGRMARIVPRFRTGARWSAARLLEERARQAPDRPALLFEDRRYTWKELDRQVDRTARAFRELGIGPDDSVALLMDNRPEFLFAVTGLSRLRAIGALINTNITGAGLVHAIDIGKPAKVIVGSEHADKLLEIQPHLEQRAHVLLEFRMLPEQPLQAVDLRRLVRHHALEQGAGETELLALAPHQPAQLLPLPPRAGIARAREPAWLASMRSEAGAPTGAVAPGG